MRFSSLLGWIRAAKRLVDKGERIEETWAFKIIYVGIEFESKPIL